MSKTLCTLLFLIKGDQVLLAMKKRGFGANRYNGVGGKVDSFETIEQALVRECQEEINVTPLEFEKVAEHDFIWPEKGKSVGMYVHVYLCKKWQGQPIETEEMAPEWFDVNEIPYEKMWQDDIYWLPRVLKGEKVFGSFTFDAKDNMLTHDIREL